MPPQTRNAPSRTGSQTMTISSQSVQESIPSLLGKQAHIRRELLNIRQNKATPRTQRYLVDSAMKVFQTLDDKTPAGAAAGLTVLDLTLKSIQSQTQEAEIRNTFEDLLDVEGLSLATIVAALTAYESILVQPTPAVSGGPVSEASKEGASIDDLYTQLDTIRKDKTKPRPHRDLVNSATDLAQTLNAKSMNDLATIHKILSLALTAIQSNAQVREIRDALEDLLDGQADAAAINVKLEAYANILPIGQPKNASSQPAGGRSKASLPPAYQSAANSKDGLSVLREFTAGERIIEQGAEETYKYGHDITLGPKRANLPDTDLSITDRQTGGIYRSHGKVNASFGHKFVFE